MEQRAARREARAEAPPSSTGKVPKRWEAEAASRPPKILPAERKEKQSRWFGGLEVLPWWFGGLGVDCLEVLPRWFGGLGVVWRFGGLTLVVWRFGGGLLGGLT